MNLYWVWWALVAAWCLIACTFWHCCREFGFCLMTLYWFAWLKFSTAAVVLTEPFWFYLRVAIRSFQGRVV